MLENVQKMLESYDLWDTTIKKTLIAQDLSVEIGILLYQKLAGKW